MISYYASSSEPAQVRGKTVYLQYSNRQEIVNNKTTADVAGNVLLVTIEGNDARLVSIDVLHLVFSAFGFVHKITTFEKTAGFQALVQFSDSETASAAKDALDGRSIPRDYTNPLLPVAPSAIDASGQVFSAFGPVLKIAMFDKNGGLQALIQYPDVPTAVVAKEALEGHCIYDGGYCKLHISYSRHTDLSIKVNNDRSRDYTIPSIPAISAQPSILGQQPYPMGGPGAHAYNGTQYAPVPDPRGVPPPSAGWNSAVPSIPQSMPMQMHNYPYGPPTGGPAMGHGLMATHGQNGVPHSSPMPPYHPQ
ncbi:Polypyrimidine tract-binding protein2 [Sesamum angolense]|uniref:Polypyrimidine tract-binding protein2 n=1 Tax=Sesamum angolense TaxID=2727404 RepID=A0AAE1TCH7_9LAMI|nr:Polypyrimidine tract-binding protein2 [Sesamum angolense]